MRVQCQDTIKKRAEQHSSGGQSTNRAKNESNSKLEDFDGAWLYQGMQGLKVGGSEILECWLVAKGFHLNVSASLLLRNIWPNYASTL